MSLERVQRRQYFENLDIEFDLRTLFSLIIFKSLISCLLASRIAIQGFEAVLFLNFCVACAFLLKVLFLCLKF